MSVIVRGARRRRRSSNRNKRRGKNPKQNYLLYLGATHKSVGGQNGPKELMRDNV